MSAAFLLYRAPRVLTLAEKARFDEVAALLPARVLQGKSQDAEAAGALLRVWTHKGAEPEPTIRGSSGRWIAFVGNPAGTSGAVYDLASKFVDTGELRLAERLSPPFAAVAHLGDGDIEVAVDRIGLQHVYVAEED